MEKQAGVNKVKNHEVWVVKVLVVDELYVNGHVLTEEPIGSGSRRGVAKLSAEQLVRKRAADREAQRAIRQRTREHIQNLEQRIDELSRNGLAEEPFLEEMKRKNVELEEEISRLKVTLKGLESGRPRNSNGKEPTLLHEASGC